MNVEFVPRQRKMWRLVWIQGTLPSILHNLNSKSHQGHKKTKPISCHFKIAIPFYTVLSEHFFVGNKLDPKILPVIPHEDAPEAWLLKSNKPSRLLASSSLDTTLTVSESRKLCALGSAFRDVVSVTNGNIELGSVSEIVLLRLDIRGSDKGNTDVWLSSSSSVSSAMTSWHPGTASSKWITPFSTIISFGYEPCLHVRLVQSLGVTTDCF